MFRIAAAGFIWAIAVTGALAQPIATELPETAPPAESTGTSQSSAAVAANSAADMVQRICDRVPTRGPITELDLQFFRSCQEALKIQQENLKLEQETYALENQNSFAWASVLVSFAAPFFTLLGALAPVVWGLLQKNKADRHLIRTQRAKEQAARREAHTYLLLDHMLAQDSSRRSFAAAGLIAMIKEDLEPKTGLSRDALKERAEDGADAAERREAVGMIATLFGRLRGKGVEPEEAKFIADELGKVLSNQKPSTAPVRFADFNLQQIRAPNAYWKKVDASDADFFDSDFSETSFREAILHRTVFYKAKLFKAVFTNAELNEANFSGADIQEANFRGARLEGALLADARNIETALFDDTTTWDERTTWPPGFDPAGNGLSPHPTPSKPPKPTLFPRRSSRRVS